MSIVKLGRPKAEILHGGLKCLRVYWARISWHCRPRACAFSVIKRHFYSVWGVRMKLSEALALRRQPASARHRRLAVIVSRAGVHRGILARGARAMLVCARNHVKRCRRAAACNPHKLPKNRKHPPVAEPKRFAAKKS